MVKNNAPILFASHLQGANYFYAHFHTNKHIHELRININPVSISCLLAFYFLAKILRKVGKNIHHNPVHAHLHVRNITIDVAKAWSLVTQQS